MCLTGAGAGKLISRAGCQEIVPDGGRLTGSNPLARLKTLACGRHHHYRGERWHEYGES